MSSSLLLPLIESLIPIAQRAGVAILSLYQNKDTQLRIEAKADSTPLTQADIQSHQILSLALSQLTPTVPVLSEEGELAPLPIRSQWQSYWLIDPLDGTKEFIAHTDEFCICIALMEKHRPVLGLIYLPITDTTYYAVHQGGAFVRPGQGPSRAIRTRSIRPAPDPISVLVSRRHRGPKLLALLSGLARHYEVNPLGSAIKFTRIAEGLADIYPSAGKTQAWDTAAGQCILEEAGGTIIDLSGQTLSYVARASVRNPAFLAVGDPSYPWQGLLAAMA